MELNELIDKNRIPIFVCIGSMKSIPDSIAPRIGTVLKRKGYIVIGTEENPIHALNIYKRILEELSIDKTLYQIIAIDACIRGTHYRAFEISTEGLYPGAGLNKKFTQIGEAGITCDIYYREEITPEEKQTLYLTQPALYYEENQQMTDVKHNVVAYIENQYESIFGERDLKALKVAGLYLYYDASIRLIEERLYMSRTSIWNHMNKYLRRLNKRIYTLCRECSAHHVDERQFNGGKSTKIKFKGEI